SSPADWRLHRSPGTLLLTGMIRTRAGRAFASRLFHVRISPTWSDAEPPRSLAARVRAPLAIVHGERDRFIPAREAAGLHSAGQALGDHDHDHAGGGEGAPSPVGATEDKDEDGVGGEGPDGGLAPEAADRHAAEEDGAAGRGGGAECTDGGGDASSPGATEER